MDEYIAYHGTNNDNVEPIRENGFNLSSAYNDWLGDGAYFFIEGISCPIKNARFWAINNAWDKKNKYYTYQYYAVLKAKISGERIFDLRNESTLVEFNRLRTKLLEKYENEKKSFKTKIDPDTYLFNNITELLKIDIIIHNLYIKTKQHRINKIQSRIPNATVLCAKKNSKIQF
jgi:hypothetical protein